MEHCYQLGKPSSVDGIDGAFVCGISARCEVNYRSFVRCPLAGYRGHGGATDLGFGGILGRNLKARAASKTLRIFSCISGMSGGHFREDKRPEMLALVQSICLFKTSALFLGTHSLAATNQALHPRVVWGRQSILHMGCSDLWVYTCLLSLPLRSFALPLHPLPSIGLNLPHALSSPCAPHSSCHACPTYPERSTALETYWLWKCRGLGPPPAAG